MVADVRFSRKSNNRFTIKRFLVPLLSRPRVAKTVKYSVYTALVINFGLYFLDDYMAYHSALAANAPMADVLERFSTSIDMAAWLGLVFLLELETHALPDEAFKGWLPKALRLARVICYSSIFYAAFAYTNSTLDNYKVAEIPNVDNICQLADKEIFLQTSVIDYIEITAENCATIAEGERFFKVDTDVSVIDEQTLKHIQWLGWIDVDNAIVWLIVVALIELEVWLQSNDRFSGRTLRVVRQVKTFFYLVLIGNATTWAITGYYLYTWDSFLWIFGFWAIELNLAEWERDRLLELDGQAAKPA